MQLAWALWHCNNKQGDAESTYYDILDEDVLCWQALIDRARMNLASGKWALAMYDLVMVRAMGKADADVLNDLGVSHFELSHDSKAAECFTEAVGKSPNHAAAFANRANVYKRQGRLREAEEDYTRAINIDETNPKAYINRGTLLKEQGLSVRAHRDFERALVLDASNIIVQQELKSLGSKLAEAKAEAGGGGGGGGGENSESLRRERL